MLLYYRSTAFAEKPLPWRLGMAALRGAAVTVLCLLLLSPIIRTRETEVKKPVLLVLQDASESAGFGMDEKARASLTESLDGLRAALEDDFEVRLMAFGNSVKEGPDARMAEKETDIEQAMRYAREAFDPARMSGVVLVSDGLYNKGSNPLYSTQVTQAPVFSVPLGNPAPVRDLAIKRLFHNKIAYRGDRFSVQLDILARNAAAERSELSIYDMTSGTPRLLEKRPVSIGQDPFFQTQEIILSADAPGIRRFRFTLTPISGEQVKGNNTREMYIEVLDARQKVLLLADAPHPDLSAIRQSLDALVNYKVDLHFLGENTGPLKAYDLVILHQIPSRRNKAGAVLQELRQSRVPVWFIAGGSSDIPALSAAQGLLEIRGDGGNMNESQALPVAGFQVFTLDEDARSGITRFPPLLAPFGDYRTGSAARPMLRQRIGAVQTDYPLWLFGEDDQRRLAILAGEGIWKWRLFDYLQHRDHAIIDEYIGKTVNYLATREDKRRLRVLPVKPIFAENEPVRFDGELYNENYERITEPDIRVVIKDAENREYVFLMNRTETMYTLNAGLLPPGNYAYRATASHNGKELVFDGRFSVQPVDQELADLQADHDLLRLLAERSGGASVSKDSLTSLPDLIRGRLQAKPVMYSSVESRPLINWKWLFALLILFLGAEWFLRRYAGSY